MNDLRSIQGTNPFITPFDESDPAPQHATTTTSTNTNNSRPRHDDWEDWSSDGHDEDSQDYDEESDDGLASDEPRRTGPPLLATIEEADSPLLASFPKPPFSNQTLTPAAASSSAPASASASSKPLRLKSRARQKAQNAQAGIRLVTDMTKLRKQQQQQQQQQHHQHQQQPQMAQIQMPTAPGKFVDAAALRALEGKPSDSSIGNWNWLRRKTDKKDKKDQDRNTPPPSAQDLSPNDRPIVIGISLPEDDLVGRTVSPYTAVLETPLDRFPTTQSPPQPKQQTSARQPAAMLSPGQIQSVWSPDTEEGSPASVRASTSRATSSVYSHYYGPDPNDVHDEPPVPSLPSAYRDLGPSTTTHAVIPKPYKDTLVDDYDDADTPITLFEEDNSPVSFRRASRLARANTGATATTTATKRRRSLAPTIDSTRSGWWDHVQTPFNEQAAASFAAFTPTATAKLSPLTLTSAKLSPLTLTPASATSPLAREYIPAVPAMPANVPTLSVPVPRTASPAPAPAPALSTAPPPADSPVVAFTAPSPVSPTDWWKVAEEKRARSASPPAPAPGLIRSASVRSSTSKPALGISTAVANAHAHTNRAVDRASPTVASSSRADPAPSQSLETPRMTPGLTPRQTPSDAPPPPYEPSSRPEMAVRYRAVFPPGHPLRHNFPPSPGSISPGLAHTMTSQGAIHMADVPLTPPGARNAAAAAGMPFPSRPSGALLPGTAMVASSAAAKVERTRRRHEKEDAAGRHADNFWRGRGCMPTRGGLFGRNQAGRASRKRRRLICLMALGAIALVVTLITVLVTVLKHKKSDAKIEYSFWLNTTDFPPIPTGVTAVGTQNTQNKNGCVAPKTLWSCSLPKEQQAANAPSASDAPSFFFDIQFDNSATKLWDVADGAVPTPTPSITGTVSSATTSVQQYGASFTPSPAPPSFQEMWFLGNTTDDIVADRKAGEPTPFFVTLLTSLNATTAGLNEVTRRGVAADAQYAKRAESSSDAPSSTATSTSASAKKTTSKTSATTSATATSTKLSTSTSATSTASPTISGTAADGFPSPSVNADGTGAPAVMHPQPVQQPLRLYDRGLDTEHFGFYAHFDKTIYVQSIDPTSSTGLASDASGGSRAVDANHVVTWLQTRFLVQIWTRMQNTTALLSPAQQLLMPSNATEPGTFPYPITITEDLHGGDFQFKGVYARAVNTDHEIVLTDSSAIVDNLSFGGTLVNHAANPTFGGTDGGSGGCKCVWNNFVGLNGNVIGS